MTKRQIMNEKIVKHGNELKAFFKLDESVDPIKLSKSLFRLENKAHHATTCLCNTNTLNLMELNRLTGYDVHQSTEAEQDAFFDTIKTRLAKSIGKDNMDKVFINHDPRGYALKIKAEYSQEFYNKDFGGFGILAPDFNDC